jgi:hypothetical protein
MQSRWMSQVNYSSIRAGLIEFRRRMEALQWQLIVPGLCPEPPVQHRRHRCGDGVHR